MGERVLKTGLAVAIAWQLGTMVPGASSPYLAPMVALLVMQITIADSLSAAVQRVLGVVVGVLVAIGVLSVIGVNAITIGLLVMVSLMVGQALKLGPQGVPQVAVSALLVVALGAESSVGFATTRIAETLIGAVVGVGINAILAPPSHLDAARAALERHAQALSAMMGHLATAIEHGLTTQQAIAVLTEARNSDSMLRDAQAAITRTETALKFNLWHRDEQPMVPRMKLAMRALERTAIQARGIVRTIEDAAEESHPNTPSWLRVPGSGAEIASAAEAASSLFVTFVPTVLDPSDSATHARFDEAASRMDAARAAVEHDISDNMTALMASSSDAWVPLGSVIADLDRIRRELQAASSGELLTASLPATAPSS